MIFNNFTDPETTSYTKDTSPSLFPSKDTPYSIPGHHWSTFCPDRLVYGLFKWNYIVSSFICLASFIQDSDCEIHT